MADEAAQSVINLFPGLENTDSFVINAFDMHMVFIIFLTITSLVGLYVVMKHYNKLFTRWMRLAVAFGFIFGIGVGELLEHTAAPPGGHYWHYVHLASGVVAIYFFYIFAKTWDIKTPENKLHVARDVILALVILLGSMYVLFAFESAGNGDVDAFLFISLTVLTFILLLKAWTGMASMTKQLEHTFSLKIFLLTSMVYALIAVLFLLVVDVDLMGTALTTLGHNPYTTLARIIQNMLYIVVTTTIMLFSFITIRADEYYKPLVNFMAAAGKAREAAPAGTPAKKAAK